MKTITKENIIQWNECTYDFCDKYEDGPEKEADCLGCSHLKKIGPYVHVSVLQDVLKDLLNQGFVANHEDDKDCGNKTYATSYDVVEIADIKKAFEGILEERDHDKV